MNRILLTCVALALPQFAAAAPCDLLPYASQCQGSNLWPVPAGWLADSDGDCQPTPNYKEVDSFSLGTLYPKHSSADAACASAYPEVAWTQSGYCNAAQTGRHEWGTSSGYHCTSGPTGSSPYPSEWDSAASANSNRCCRISYNRTASPCVASSSAIPALTSSTVMPVCTDPAYVVRWLQPNGTFGPTPHTGSRVVCMFNGGASPMKPADNRCTARRMPDGSLQKDPLDPDCDANSCVLDGTCGLR